MSPNALRRAAVAYHPTPSRFLSAIAPLYDSLNGHRVDDATAAPQPELAQIFGPAYDELRRLAGQHLQRERRGHTLQPTALVNEAFVKLAPSLDGTELRDDRAQFLALAARAMRQVLVDYARKHQARKRGEGQRRITLSDTLLASEHGKLDALALDDALEKLAALDARMASVVEMRFFGGLGIDEIAAVLNVSDRTIDRDWRVARAWLMRSLSGGDPL